jgi:hypothetical protein
MAKSISTARSYEVKKTEQVIEITQKNLLHDFEQEEVDDDTASNDE